MAVIAKRWLFCCSLGIMETLVSPFSLHLLIAIFKAVWSRQCWPRSWSENDWNKWSTIKFLRGCPFHLTLNLILLLPVHSASHLSVCLCPLFHPFLLRPFSALFNLFFYFRILFPLPHSSLQSFLCPSFILHIQTSHLIYSIILFIHISYHLSFCFLCLASNNGYLFMWGNCRCTVKGHTLLLSFAHCLLALFTQ